MAKNIVVTIVLILVASGCSRREVDLVKVRHQLRQDLEKHDGLKVTEVDANLENGDFYCTVRGLALDEAGVPVWRVVVHDIFPQQRVVGIQRTEDPPFHEIMFTFNGNDLATKVPESIRVTDSQMRSYRILAEKLAVLVKDVLSKTVPPR